VPAQRLWPETVVAFPALCEQVSAILGAWGMSQNDVAVTTQHLLYADLHGIDSHGCGMLRHYHRGRQIGALRMDAQVTVVRDDGASLLLDGGGGLGHVPSARAMALAIERARNLGIAAVSVRHSGHFGAAGTYVAMAADAGMIGMATTNTGRPALVPTFGREAALGTNPIAFAAPTAHQPPFLLDMATTTVPVGRVMTAWRRGEVIPSGWALDERGDPVTDPGQGVRLRRLTPLGGSRSLGGHKGYGLATMVEILSAILPGLDRDVPKSHAAWRVGHFFLVINPARFRSEGVFQQDLDDLIDRLRSTTPLQASQPVQVAGDPERQAQRTRQMTGIPLPRSVLEDIRYVSREAGVPYLLESP
jgi:LDH2 family malate/lactate/ureidoglycolate dehydrogenase